MVVTNVRVVMWLTTLIQMLYMIQSKNVMLLVQQVIQYLSINVTMDSVEGPLMEHSIIHKNAKLQAVAKQVLIVKPVDVKQLETKITYNFQI